MKKYHFSDKEILDVLKTALRIIREEKNTQVRDEIYLPRTTKGICNALFVSFEICLRAFVPLSCLWMAIPEFNREEVHASLTDKAYWWPRYDFDSRIRALEKLIEIYKQKVNHENSEN